MSNLTINALELSGTNNVFEKCFKSQLENIDTVGIESKIKFLRQLCRNLEVLDNNIENNKNTSNWIGIGAAISAVATLMAAPVLPLAIPFAPIIFNTVLAACTSAAVGGAVTKTQVETQVAGQLKRYGLALGEFEVSRWAALWEVCGTDIFIDSLYEAAKGEIHGNKLIKRENSWDSAVEYAASVTRRKPKDLVGIISIVLTTGINPAANQLASSLPVKPETFSLPISPAQSVNDSIDLFGNAVLIRDSLVNRADKSVLGGCVILAAPGSGKTTFLGSAWGKLKETYGTKFKSLAVVVKKSDVDSFRGVSDDCLCVKSGAVTAAIAIIKFIDGSTSHTGNVSRLFLDDFLTMQKYFETSLKGSFVDPATYSVFASKKESLEFTYDAVPLHEHLMTLLNEYWLVGREYNSALWVSSHSSNVKDLPFMGSASTRSVGDMIFLAKNGKREFIELALGNSFLISDEAKRAVLKQELNSINLKTDEPIILGNFNNWTLGIVSNNIYQEYIAYRKLWESNAPTVLSSVSDAPAANFVTKLSTKTLEVVKGISLEDVDTDELDEDDDDVEDYTSYIIRLACVAKSYLIEKEIMEFDVDTLRRSRYFEAHSTTGKRLTTKEVKDSIKVLLLANFVTETSPGSYKVLYLG